MVAIATRVEKLEAQVGDDGPDCPTCAARPYVTIEGRDPPVPDRCPHCHRPIEVYRFTLRLMGPRGLLDPEEA